MQDTLITPLFALIGVVVIAVSGALTASIPLAFAGRQRREERDAQWKRDDDMEQRVKDANAEIARKAELNADKVVAAQLTTNAEIGKVHALVNSDMTLRYKAELTLNEFIAVMLREKIDAVEPGATPPQSVVAALGAVEARITELRQIIDERAKQQAMADAQLAQDKMNAEATKVAAAAVELAVADRVRTAEMGAT